MLPPPVAACVASKRLCISSHSFLCSLSRLKVFPRRAFSASAASFSLWSRPRHNTQQGEQMAATRVEMLMPVPEVLRTSPLCSSACYEEDYRPLSVSTAAAQVVKHRTRTNTQGRRSPAHAQKKNCRAAKKKTNGKSGNEARNARSSQGRPRAGILRKEGKNKTTAPLF